MNSMSDLMRLCSLLLLATIILAGCESWKVRDESSPSGKAPILIQSLRMPVDSVGLEVAVATIDRAQLKEYQDLWKEVDTSCIKLEQRKILDQNGFVVGVISSHVPAALQRLLEPDPIDEESLDSWQAQLFEKGLLNPEPKVILHDGIQNRKGETHPIPVSQHFNEMSWVVKNGSKTMAGAGTQVRAVMEVKTYPKGDGTVRIVCTPTLHLGQPRPQIGVSQQAFVYESAQDKQSLNDLRFELCLRSGESAIIGPTADIGDLGQLFFGSPDSGEIGMNDSEPISTEVKSKESIRFLMVRLLHTRMDDLFKPNSLKEELSSTSLD